MTLDPAPLVGEIRVKIASDNTAAATLNVNGGGAQAITRSDGSALVAGDSWRAGSCL